MDLTARNVRAVFYKFALLQKNYLDATIRFMTKTQWITLGLIVVIGVGWYFLMRSGSAPSADTEGDSLITKSDDRKMSFGDFVKQGGSYKCDIEQTVGSATTKGTAYVNDGMIKGEYVTQADGLSITSYVVVRDGYAYTWTSFAPNMGLKARVVENASADSSTQTSGQDSFNTDDVDNYDCEPWTADASVFALPTGVKFSEIRR